MDDIYTTRDFILLWNIIENRFQLMHGIYGSNPRKYNSASSFSGRIEQDLSTVIVALPITNENKQKY